MMRRESGTIGNTTHFNGSPWYVGNFSDTVVRRASNPWANYEYNAWNAKLLFCWAPRRAQEDGQLKVHAISTFVLNACSWKPIWASYRWIPLVQFCIDSGNMVVEQIFEVAVLLARRMLSSGLWRHVVQQTFADVSEECTTPIFSVEE